MVTRDFMRELCWMASLMAMDEWNIMMDACTAENGSVDSGTVPVRFNLPMATLSRAITRKINDMAMVSTGGRMDEYMTVAFNMINEKDWESTSGLMERVTRDGSRRGYEKEKVLINLPMEVCIRESGNLANIMDLVNVHGQTVEFTRENGIWERHMVMELNIEGMEHYDMMEFGDPMSQ
jgi:hypothetical protein